MAVGDVDRPESLYGDVGPLKVSFKINMRPI